MSKNVRAFTFTFWEMTAFFASSAAFLYLGISMNIVDVAEHLPLIVLSFVAVLAARAAAIPYPCCNDEVHRGENSDDMETCYNAWWNARGHICGVGRITSTKQF